MPAAGQLSQQTMIKYILQYYTSTSANTAYLLKKSCDFVVRVEPPLGPWSGGIRGAAILSK